MSDLYINDRLPIETIDYSRIVSSVGTPVYVYSAQKIRNQYHLLRDVLSAAPGSRVSIRYAVKANPNLEILRLIQQMGSGAEIVSGGELTRALAAGFLPEQIVFSGVGKSDQEIIAALAAGVDQISVESLEELHLIQSIAQSRNLTAPICLRINPNIDGGTHEKITTGLGDNKFGIPLPQLNDAIHMIKTSSHSRFLGLSVHLGSQINTIAPYTAAFKLLGDLARTFLSKGLPVKRLDLGGGFCVPQRPTEPPFDMSAFAQSLRKELGSLDCDFIIEPGRFLVAEAGYLLTKILYIKKTLDKTFVIIDAGMNDLIRPALYGATHPIISCEQSLDTDQQIVDVVGPVCESSDIFAKGISLSKTLKSGDIVAITHVGAYGASLSSAYNSRPLIPEVLVEGDKFYLIRDRITVEHLLKFEHRKLLS
ncbi:MAG: diaminopimelate decarboxylase [Alphaproteobacteria bacterium]|nr:diaminopimelate decarboxylase [Alphaproteobacteria bacterium]